ncbi:zinc finger protein 227-like [Hydractinia symbiolongicarpus]|uniref:zinc finger protein 227-like n=1 Tax=Hydractinia symbiolongicarpus TaxID=13093 RepID=UPI00254AD8DB|nr:zinc finger protein 227-like [Hydractinia symbiolongicarpus]
MPKTFLVKKPKGKDELEEPVLDQQVPSGNPFYYHPAFYYPAEYYSYLPTLWARHYQDIATNWQGTDKQYQNGNAPGGIPGLNLPQPLNLPSQVSSSAFAPNPLYQAQQQHNGGGIPTMYHQHSSSQQQSDQQFQQQFQQLINQHHQNAQLQQQQQYGAPNHQHFETDSNDKVKRDLYNEFFDLDNNAIKKEDSMLLPNAVAAALGNHTTHRVKKERGEDGSETDSVSSDSSKCSESSSAAVVDNIINHGVDIKRDDKMLSRNGDGELSPKSGEEGDKVYQCAYCAKKFTRSWNYQRHVLIHSGRKPHKCEVCDKAFVLAAHLKIHMRIHTGEKPYKCTVCGRGFAQLTNLQRHVLTHTGQKPHRCQHCNKGFVSSSDLRRHIRIHTGEKPYQCHACSKAFTTSGNLQSHVLTHTGVKPYSCSICKWKFISSSNLRTHIRTHHCNNDESNELQMVPDNTIRVVTPSSTEEQVFLPATVKTN